MKFYLHSSDPDFTMVVQWNDTSKTYTGCYWGEISITIVIITFQKAWWYIILCRTGLTSLEILKQFILPICLLVGTFFFFHYYTTYLSGSYKKNCTDINTLLSLVILRQATYVI